MIYLRPQMKVKQSKFPLFVPACSCLLQLLVNVALHAINAGTADATEDDETAKSNSAATEAIAAACTSDGKTIIYNY